MDCPECGRVLNEKATSCACGWGRVTGTAKQNVDPDWWRCCDTNQFGERCSKPGALSDSTFGKGPWYCSQHYPEFRGRSVKRTEPPGGFQLLRDPLARHFAQREPGEEG